MCITLLWAGFLQFPVNRDGFFNHNIGVDEYFFFHNLEAESLLLKNTLVGVDKLPRHRTKPAW